jgi:hypothetical protein
MGVSSSRTQPSDSRTDSETWNREPGSRGLIQFAHVAAREPHSSPKETCAKHDVDWRDAGTDG